MADYEETTSAPDTGTQAGNGDVPQVDDSRAALVKEWTDKIKRAKRHHEKKAFKQMRENMRFAARGASDEWIKSGKYVVPILSKVVNQAVARLYAKNPTAVAKRRKKMLYTLWDGRTDSLQASMQMAQMGDPNAMALLMEVAAGVQQDLMYDRMAKTMEILFEYYIDEQEYDYQTQIKAAVRRVEVCKVAYCKLGFQRILQPRPEIMGKIADVTSQITALEGLLAEIAEGDVDETSARLEESRLLLATLQADSHMIVREGPVLDFPRAEKVIIDPACIHLKSFAGARWVAQEFDMTPCEVQEVYKVDVKGEYKKHEDDSDEMVYRDLFSDSYEKDDDKCRVWEVQDRRNQQFLTIVDGYCDFIKEPAPPDVKLERFWTLFPLVFNEIEHDREIYPASTIENGKHIQEEYNRTREALREHRIAARPWWAAGGNIEEEETKKVGNHVAHEVVHFKGMTAGMKIKDMIDAGPTAPIDPNLYQVEEHWNDLMRVGGFQEASLGATSGDTATESSIAAGSLHTADGSDVDDLDKWLSQIARSFGQLMLQELSKQTVIEIAGPGAVWPDMPQSREEAAKDLYLEIKAGSSGRPNRAAELADMERAAPMLVQIPGVSPTPLAKKYMNLLEIDIEEGIAEGMPSITAMNAIITKMAGGQAGPGGPGAQSTGDPRSDPNQQGPQGAQNALGPQQNERPMGPQPGFPAPMATPGIH